MNINLNYAFQYRFRIESIQFYFYKELLCAFLMLIIFQYVNYRYLVMFSNKVLRGEETSVSSGTNATATSFITPATLQNVNNSVKDYVDWSFWIIFLSTALIFQHILKICFNIWSNLKIGIDKWTILDTVSASLNIIAIVII